MRLFADGGNNKIPLNCERFKEQLNRIDGTVVWIADDCSYVDVKIPEANYGLIRWVQLLFVW